MLLLYYIHYIRYIHYIQNAVQAVVSEVEQAVVQLGRVTGSGAGVAIVEQAVVLAVVLAGAPVEEQAVKQAGRGFNRRTGSRFRGRTGSRLRGGVRGRRGWLARSYISCRDGGGG